MKRRAFTLVEMLVVVGVIVALVAILLPSLSKAYAAARRASCQANAHGLTQTFNLYISDWNSLVPYYTSSTVPNNGPNQWTIPLTPGTVGDKIRVCPESTVSNPLLYATGTSEQVWNHPAASLAQTGGYTFNGWLYLVRMVPPAPPPPPPPPPGDEDSNPSDADDLSPPPPVTPPPAPYAPKFVADPTLFFRLPITRNISTIPVFADGTWSESFPMPTDAVPANLSTGSGNSSTDQLGQVCITRHGKVVNVSFVDGHAENVKLPELWSKQWHMYWQAPTPLPVVAAQ
jgi:prepilin-type processing-associated H-X9-DG protein/prepilin-type N-terminal cleavage/methylation domain-containing protein